MSEQLLINIHLLENAREPFKATDGSAGYDLYSYKTLTIEPKSIVSVSVGCRLEIPKGYFGRILPRSGFALRNKLTTDAGVVDSDYRGGVVHVLLKNWSDANYIIEKDDRIAQIVFLKCSDVCFIKKDKLSDSERQYNGFGSTGIN